jgi:hypothetical protein
MIRYFPTHYTTAADNAANVEHAFGSYVCRRFPRPFCFLDMALPADQALMVWYDSCKQAAYGLPRSASIANRHAQT